MIWRKKLRPDTPVDASADSLTARDHSVDEKLVHSPILRKLGMKCGRQQISLPHQHGESFAAGQDFDARTVCGDARRADEDHLQRAAGKRGRFGQDRRVDLAAVGIALDRPRRAARELRCAGWRTSRASRIAPAQVPKTGRVAANSLSDSKRSARSRNFSMVVDSPPGRISPSRDLAVRAKVLTDFAPGRNGAGFGQRFGVRGVVALNGKHADAGAHVVLCPICRFP